MNESVSTSEKTRLLSLHNLGLAAGAVLVLSLVGMFVSMLQTNDSGGMGRDSFGTHAQGYRAVFEVLEEVGVNVERRVAPPDANARADTTLVLIDPNPRLAGHNPKYFQKILSWVEAGGRLVVAPSATDLSQIESESEEDDTMSYDVLDLLELSNRLELQEFMTVPLESSVSQSAPSAHQHNANEESGSTWDDIVSAWNAVSKPPQVVEVECTGELSSLSPGVQRLAVPARSFNVLSPRDGDLAGAVLLAGEAKIEELLIAAVQRGQGEIVVISDPYVMSNIAISRADNSVLAVDLIAARTEHVVFDEFFHGLAVRGNPLYLLTRPGFTAVSLGILAAIGVWIWRSAVFLGPPLPDKEHSRRDIGEYIRAMGLFFSRAHDHRQFLAHEVRNGVLHQLSVNMGLPADCLDVDVICAALARRDPQRATTLRQTISQIDARLTTATDFPQPEFLSSLRQLTGCL